MAMAPEQGRRGVSLNQRRKSDPPGDARPEASIPCRRPATVFRGDGPKYQRNAGGNQSKESPQQHRLAQASGGATRPARTDAHAGKRTAGEGTDDTWPQGPLGTARSVPRPTLRDGHQFHTLQQRHSATADARHQIGCPHGHAANSEAQPGLWTTACHIRPLPSNGRPGPPRPVPPL